MIIICHNCQSRYKVRDDIVAWGPKKARCKNCGADMLISPPRAGESLEAGLLTRPVGQESPGAAKPAAKAKPPDATPKAAPGQAKSEDSHSVSATEAPAETAVGRGDAGASGTPPAAENTESNVENAMAKLEKRRREMEDEIAGRLHKAALETLDFQDLEFLGNKLKGIESNPNVRLEDEVQLFACIKCKAVFGLYPDDPRQCPNCPGELPLIRGQDLMRQFGMFNR